MNKYIIIKLKSDWAKANVHNNILRHARDMLPFHPEVIHYYALSNTLIFSAETTTGGSFSRKDHVYWNEHYGEALLFDGVPFYEGFDSSELWAKAIARRLKSLGTRQAQEHILGTYNLTHIGPDGITAFTDFTGTYPLFYLDNEHVTAISNRQLLLAKTCQPASNLSYDFEVMSWLPGQAAILGDRSIFHGVRHLKPSQALHIGKDLSIRELTTPFWAAPKRNLQPNDFDDMTDLLLRQSEALRELPITSGGLSLTGGKDSRLVLALAIESGLIERTGYTFTNGKHGSPEIEIAQYISETVGVEHRANISKPSQTTVDSIWTKLKHHAFRFEGSVCSWDGGGGSVARSSQLELNGMVGALYSRNLARDLKGKLRTTEEAHKLFANYLQPTDPLSIMDRELRDFQRQSSKAMIDELVEREVDLNDLTDVMHSENRLPWWAGLLASNTFGRTRIFPLANLSALRIAYQGGHEQRQIARHHFEILRRLHPKLASLPFLKDQWHDGLRKYGSDAYTTKPFTTTNTASSQNMFPWQWQFIEDGWKSIQDFLTSYPASGLYEIFDKSRLNTLLGSPETIRRTIDLKEVLSAITLQIVLTGQSLALREGNEVAPEIRTNATDAENHWTHDSSPNLYLTKLRFSLPYNNITSIRIDPIDSQCKFVLGDISVLRGDHHEKISVDGRTGLRANRHVKRIGRGSARTTYVATSEDPYFEVMAESTLDKKLSLDGATVEVELAVSRPGRACIYYDLGNGFSEDNKISLRLDASSLAGTESP